MVLGHSLQVILGGQRESGVVTRHEPADGSIKRSPQDLLASMDQSLRSVAVRPYSFHVSGSHDKRTTFTYQTDLGFHHKPGTPPTTSSLFASEEFSKSLQYADSPRLEFGNSQWGHGLLLSHWQSLG